MGSEQESVIRFAADHFSHARTGRYDADTTVTRRVLAIGLVDLGAGFSDESRLRGAIARRYSAERRGSRTVITR